MYLRTLWKDHVVEFPDRFTETDNGDGTTEHVASPGSTLQEGTNQDALHFNNLEEGVVCLATAFDLYYATTQAMIRDLDTRLAVAEAALASIP